MDLVEAKATFGASKYIPLALTGLLILWTAVVYPFSKYGDAWAIYPAVSIFPATIIAHVWLVIVSRPRLNALLYGLLHISIQFVIWLGCLMLIGKDSF